MIKRLTEHFCLDEFTHSGIAVDNAINNQPPPCACLALQNLAVGLLEPLRLLYAPIAILSGYRNEKVNRLAGRVCYPPTRERSMNCYVATQMGRKNCWMYCNVCFPGLVLTSYCYGQETFCIFPKINDNRMQVLVYNKS